LSGTGVELGLDSLITSTFWVVEAAILDIFESDIAMLKIITKSAKTSKIKLEAIGLSLTNLNTLSVLSLSDWTGKSSNVRNLDGFGSLFLIIFFDSYGCVKTGMLNILAILLPISS
jgi:hypothetical protein